ncbi:hypothetical protein PanWU01x14_261950 [Parasponia andersonii]|uniref:Uncharacterized protein n=1 Tax=Parasponia andersonii TaxID=3476 RepID=A0A2P5B8C7_PARAD|nr:hypothetical protein PanWU01x14_261950 [Parasponia andersonii]
METASAIFKDLGADLPPKSHLHFPTHNGFNSPDIQIPDIEITSVHSVGYTSLRDLMPSSSSSPAAMSPTPSSSWYEVPIKNPLVKHAAMAYLQPMSSPPEIGDKGLLARLKEKCLCGGAWGCFGWLNDVVLGAVREFWRRRRRVRNGDEDDDDEEEEEDEDEDNEKVD